MRNLVVSVIFGAVVVGCAQTAADTPAADTPAADTPAAETLAAETAVSEPPVAEAPDIESATPTPDAEARARQRSKLMSRVWWNHAKKVEEIGLGDEQRAAMDAILTDYLDHRRPMAKQKQSALDALGRSLLSGDAGAARAHGDEVVAASSSPIRKQVDMMIEVVALLTPEQRQALAGRYPKLLSRLWIASMRTPGAGGRRRGGS